MDSAVLLLPAILAALITTTSSLSCTECSGAGGRACQGAAVTCLPDFDVCVATLESSSNDGKEVTRYQQYCGKKTMCTYTGSLTIDLGGKTVSSTCCYTSACTPPMPKLPTDKKEKNGVSCKACSAAEGTSCDQSTTIECTGEEKQCMTVTTTKTGQMSSTAVLRGCGTPGWCNVNEREFQYGGQATELSFTCSGANDALRQVPPLLLLSALLIAKVFS